MTRLFLITLLVLSNGPAYAEWVKVGITATGMTVYFDPDTFRRKGDRGKIWELDDYQTTQTAGGISFLSRKSQDEYDCTKERSRTLAMTEFSGHMGNGKVVYTDSDEDKWKQVVPESVAQALWRLVCDTK